MAARLCYTYFVPTSAFVRRAVLLLCAIVVLALSLRAGAGRPMPVLVELFTSEGCSSCPAADKLLQTLIESQPVAGADIIGLGLHVDYWDQLGWKDRFSSAALTNRQQGYGRNFRIDAIYTPQMVVDGRQEFVGSDANVARRAIGKAMSAPHGVLSIALEPAVNDRVAVTVNASELPALSRGDHADIVLAVTESQLRSDVRGGENRGRLLTHAAVVRQLTTIGEAASPQSAARFDVTMAPTWQRDHLTIVAFVQERSSRRVLGAAAMPLQSAPR